MLCIVSALGLNAQTWTASDLAEGKYVFQNVATGRYLGPSNSWGTQASLLEASHFNTLHKISDGVYTIESQVSNGGNNYFLNGSFMDGPASNFTIQDNGEGVFTISRDGSTYYGYDGSSKVVATNLADPNSANAQWKIMAYDEVYADASEENPVDVTYMILCSNFDRNHRSASAWTMEASNKNLCGGKNENKCAESYRAAFTLSQTISVPDGYYKVRAQAALTDYANTGANFPVVYATSGASMVTRPFNTMKNGEASMDAISDQFASGNYWTEYTDVVAVANGSLTVGVKGTRTDTWCIWDNFQLMYMGPLPLSVYKEEFDKVVASAKAVKGTVPAAVYANIESVINEKDKAYESKEEYSAAATAITDAVNTNATAQIVAAYAHYNKKKAAALAVDDDTDAYEGDARVDVSEADAEVEAATTVEEIQAAEPLIEPAVSAFLESVTLKSGYRFDITDVYLENADFEVPTKNGVLPPGWDITITGQNCGQQNRTDKNPTEDTSDPDFGRSITNFIEAWHPSQLGSGVIAQTVSGLPEGTYVLECDASICHDPAGADDIVGANLFIKSPLKTEKQAISNVRLYIKHYALSFVHGGEGTVEFGLENDNSNANWLSADNFKVYFAGGIDYDALLADVVKDAEAVDEASLSEEAYVAFKAVVDDNNKAWSTREEYKAAIANISSAISVAEALAKAEAAIADAKYVNVTGSEKKDLSDAIADAIADFVATDVEALAATVNAFKAAAPSYDAYVAYKAETIALWATDFEVAAPTTAAEAVNAVAQLNVAQYNNVKDNYTYSLDGLIGDFGTWTGTATVAGEPAKPNYLDWEHWSGTQHAYYEQAADGWGNANGWTIKYEKTCKLPAGNYVLKVAARSSAGTTSKISCSAIPTTISLPCAGNNTRGINTSGAASWSDDDTFAHTGDYKSNPATVGGTGAGWQWRFLPFELDKDTEVTMTFEAEASTQYQWMSIGDAVLLSDDDPAEGVDYFDDEDNTIESALIANVTVNREIKPDFNTVVLPFNVTAVQVAEIFGEGTKVYNFSENSDNAETAEIMFQSGDGSITANVPVLVKATTASIAQEFKGVVVEKPESDIKVAGKFIDFVGTYAPVDVAEGDYFVGNGALYRSEGNTSMNAFRAFLKVKSAEVKAELFIDGVATAIESINGNVAQPAGAIYNLAGQRVQKAQRGLYIVNGKKVVVK